MGLRNRGVKPDTRTAVGSLGVLRHSRMPAQLFELPFIDGPAADIDALRNRRGEMAEVIARGILSYLGIQGQAVSPAPIQPPIACPAPAQPPQADSFVRFNIFLKFFHIQARNMAVNSGGKRVANIMQPGHGQGQTYQ